MMTMVCIKLADRQGRSRSLRFHANTETIAWMQAANEESAKLFMEANPQLAFIEHADGLYSVKFTGLTQAFDSKAQRMKTYCEACGYDRFEVTVIERKSAFIGEHCIYDEKLIKCEAIAECMACGKRTIPEYSK